jgi:Zn-dependent protease
MFRSWNLGKAFGINIYVHWSFVLLLGFVVLSEWNQAGIASAGYDAALVLSLFGCVVLHELGHALMARRFGIGTRDITLYPIGGVARLERMSERPWEEFWIAIAGPAVNVAIAILLVFPVLLTNLNTLETDTVAFPTEFLRNLMRTNVALVLFNMLPAFPMDGGRVLRALLITPLGRLRATEIAAGIGTAFALLFGFAGVSALLGDPIHVGPHVLNRPLLLLLGGFLYLAGRQELNMVRWREFNRQAEPLDAQPVYKDIVDAVPVESESPFTGYAWDSRAGVWVVWHNGRPVATYRVE